MKNSQIHGLLGCLWREKRHFLPGNTIFQNGQEGCFRKSPEIWYLNSSSELDPVILRNADKRVLFLFQTSYIILLRTTKLKTFTHSRSSPNLWYSRYNLLGSQNFGCKTIQASFYGHRLNGAFKWKMNSAKVWYLPSKVHLTMCW